MEWTTNKVSVLYCPVWDYFDCPAATEVNRKRVAIELDRRVHLFIWEIIFIDL